jgi:hypothetical protein
MSSQRRRSSSGGFGGTFMLLIVVGFIVKFWWLILLVAAGIGAGLLLWLGHQRTLSASDVRRREHAALVARADQQHAWTLAGDDRGIYGEYRPLWGRMIPHLNN